MSDQQFVLRWHYHETTLLQKLPSLLESDILTDVTLSVGAQLVKAHRIVLAMCSVYFLQIFQEMGGSTHPVIVLHNVSLEDMKAVLSFIYRGQCIVSKEQLPSLLSVARLLKIQGLCDMKVPEKTLDDTTDEDKLDIERNCTKCEVVDKQQILDQDENKAHDYTMKSRTNEVTTSYVPETKNKPIKSENISNNNNNNNKNNNHNSRYSRELNANYMNWDNLVPVTPEMVQFKPDYDQNYNLPLPKKPPKDAPETCKCFLCGKYLSNQYNLRVHMETHEEAYHACQSCPHVSRSRDALRKHVSYRHPEEYHTRKRKKTENS